MNEKPILYVDRLGIRMVSYDPVPLNEVANWHFGMIVGWEASGHRAMLLAPYDGHFRGWQAIMLTNISRDRGQPLAITYDMRQALYYGDA